MNKQIKILHVLNGLGTGGAEAIIMNWYRHIDRSKVQFDFLIRSDENIYADEIAEYGGKVFVMPPYPKCYFTNKKETNLFFQEHAKEYLCIHVHGNALLYVNIFNIAKKHGINLRIYHSHSTSTKGIYRMLHLINRCRVKNMATHFFACSEAAGVWAFGKRPYTVVKNGIAADAFAYRETKREQVRASMGICNETVYGHVGRFVPVKNHVFLLEVFERIVQKDEHSVLLLLGDGELVDSIRSMAREKGIAEKVRFVGRQQDVSGFMNAMDVFMLPSYHEGLPIVAVEAQAAGLPSLLSNSITQEVGITELVKFLPISDPEIWALQALNIRHIPRRDMREEISRSGYDIKQRAKILEDFYCSKVR